MLEQEKLDVFGPPELKKLESNLLYVDHGNGIAFRVDANKKSFIYSGDMAYDENICSLGKNADLVTIECFFPDKKSLYGRNYFSS